MPQRHPSTPRGVLRDGAAMLAGLQLLASFPARVYAQSPDNSSRTETPIKHVIVIIGENRTFDHIFATYKPVAGEKIDNLLSKGIIKEDGTPGRNYWLATQLNASDAHRNGFVLSPEPKWHYAHLPTPLAGGPTKPYITSLAEAKAVENGLPNDTYYRYLTTGGTGLKAGTPDTRIPHVNDLRPGPFQLTPGIPYDAYAASPVHRFYQMWQQQDCNISHVTAANPSGCKADQYAYVETRIGAGSNGQKQPTPFTEATTREGGSAMGFYNVLQGDAPYLKSLADRYAMSDNYHQSMMGGTGANHISMGTGDAIWFSDGKGHPAVPPHNQLVAAGTANAGVVDEIENPNPAPGTNDWYTQDGYGGGSFGSPSFGGGSYSNCSDSGAPGVRTIRYYLNSLPYQVDPRCAAGHYYLLNNYNPGYFADGSNAFADKNDKNGVFTIPPSNLRNIGNALLEKNISWKYYGDQWNLYKKDPYFQNPANLYCNICNFLQYSSSIMENASVRTAHLKDTADFYEDVKSGNLPAVSYVKPSGLVDGHPASSKINLFEGFVKKIVDGVQANPELWKSTAIFVTVDEGGGYYDSGYVQPLDFFGDGPRIPMLVVSPYTKPGHISHEYNDHVSILKFIEKNWDLKPLTTRSRDNLPNPRTDASNPYVPSNSPAIGDLMDLFQFTK